MYFINNCIPLKKKKRNRDRGKKGGRKKEGLCKWLNHLLVDNLGVFFVCLTVLLQRHNLSHTMCGSRGCSWPNHYPATSPPTGWVRM